jgi:hypothetical protein
MRVASDVRRLAASVIFEGILKPSLRYGSVIAFTASMRCSSLGPMANAPFPIPAHQTERADFRHSAFRLASSQGTRQSAVDLMSRDDTSGPAFALR